MVDRGIYNFFAFLDNVRATIEALVVIEKPKKRKKKKWKRKKQKKLNQKNLRIRKNTKWHFLILWIYCGFTEVTGIKTLLK